MMFTGFMFGVGVLVGVTIAAYMLTDRLAQAHERIMILERQLLDREGRR